MICWRWQTTSRSYRHRRCRPKNCSKMIASPGFYTWEKFKNGAVSHWIMSLYSILKRVWISWIRTRQAIWQLPPASISTVEKPLKRLKRWRRRVSSAVTADKRYPNMITSAALTNVNILEKKKSKNLKELFTMFLRPKFNLRPPRRTTLRLPTSRPRRSGRSSRAGWRSSLHFTTFWAKAHLTKISARYRIIS